MAFKRPTKQQKITSYFVKTAGLNDSLPHETVQEPTVVRKSKNVYSSSPIYGGQKNGHLEAASNCHPFRKSTRCPFYKKIPDSPFTVDAFRYGAIPGVTAMYENPIPYYLLEFCADSLSPYPFHALPLNEACIIQGVEVELIEAHHCPGAVMFVFRLTDGRAFLHTGDFRANTDMELNPTLKSLHVNILFLDTTYCQPMYTFPSQQEVLDFVVETARKYLQKHPRTLVVCGSYTIGKEKVFKAIGEALQLKVWASKDKMRVFRCLEDKNLETLLTSNPLEAGIHVLSMNQLHFEELVSKYTTKFNNILALRPTGWEFRRGKKSGDILSSLKPVQHGSVTIYGIPYSEHSSFSELKRFVEFVNPDRIVPTVNVTGAGALRQADILQGWMRKETSPLYAFVTKRKRQT